MKQLERIVNTLTQTGISESNSKFRTSEIRKWAKFWTSDIYNMTDSDSVFGHNKLRLPNLIVLGVQMGTVRVIRYCGRTTRPTQGQPRSPIQWVPTLKRQGIETDRSSTSNVKFRNEWIYTFTLPYALMTCTEVTSSVEMQFGYFKTSKYSACNPLGYKNSWWGRLVYLPTYWKQLLRPSFTTYQATRCNKPSDHNL